RVALAFGAALAQPRGDASRARPSRILPRMNPIYNEITLLLVATAAIGLLALRLKQPLIVAYILIGILAGPSVLDWVSARQPLELLAEIGVTVLLFAVGLKLDLRLVKQLGPVALAT